MYANVERVLDGGLSGAQIVPSTKTLFCFPPGRLRVTLAAEIMPRRNHATD